METKELEKKFLAGMGPGYDIEVQQSYGSYIEDFSGKKYIDFTMGWCVGNLGWGNEEILQVIQNFSGPAYVYPGLHYRPWAELAELLCQIAPGKLSKCFRTTGGSEAVDTAMQIAMAYTGRKKFLSIEDSYHGNTIGPLSIGASDNRDKISNLLAGCYKIDKPLDEKALKKVEARLKKKDIAAFIMEPILCNAGVHVPSDAFMIGLRELCDKYGTLLIMDEVATGFGRTGKLFATEHFEISPDILCLSKAITGGYAGLGATLTTEAIYKEIEDKVNVYSTYGWHPLATDVALANVQYIVTHQNSLLENVAKASRLFEEQLSALPFRHGCEIMLLGLAISVDVKNAEYAKEIEDCARKKGLLITSQETQLVMFPALNIQSSVIDEGMEILRECI